MEVCNKANEVGGKQKRNWCCERCDEPINIFVPDNERKFIIDGDKIFCGPTCKSAYKQFIPLKISKDGSGRSKYKKGKPKEKREPKFKCFHCDKETTFMTWNKLCSTCRDKFTAINRSRIEHGEILELIGGLTNEQRSLIRLTNIK